jgi:cytochrome c2
MTTTKTHTRMRWLFSTVILVLMVTGCGMLTASQDARVEETGGNIARGEDLVRTKGCLACHSAPGMASVDNGFGPDLDGFANRRLIAGAAENEPDTLIQFLMVPRSVAPGTAMPSLQLTEDEARDIASWLYTLDD